MLTFAALKTTAYMDDSFEPYCERCASEQWGALFIARLEAGLEEPQFTVHGADGSTQALRVMDNYPANVRKLSDYEMGQFEDREAEAMAEAMAENEGETRDKGEIAEDLIGTPVLRCGGTCGRYYTGGAEPWQEWDGDSEHAPQYIRSNLDGIWTM